MTVYRDPDDDEPEDGDWDDDADIGDDADDEPTISCPYCRLEILEDSPYCPYCERYISEEDHAGPGKPVWVIATALVCLLATLYWAFSAF